MGFTYHEAYRLPLWQRNWFVERLKKELKRGSEDNPQPSRADTADPESRAMMGMHNPHAPSRLRRFT